jgi:hypothetical protein
MAINQGLAGAPTAKFADGTNPTVRMGNQGDQIVSELHGRYYEQTFRKNRFIGSITGQVTSAGLATTYTGLCLSNTPGNTVNLVVDFVDAAFLVAFAAAASVGILVGFSSTAVTHTTPITTALRNTFLGGPNPQGLVDSAATIPTPTLAHVLGQGLTGAITTVPGYGGFTKDLGGGLILPPGGFCAIYTSTASGAASMSASIGWTEVPV